MTSPNTHKGQRKKINKDLKKWKDDKKKNSDRENDFEEWEENDRPFYLV